MNFRVLSELQVLLSDHPRTAPIVSTSEILSLPDLKDFRINVLRNHYFESIAQMLTPYLALSGLRPVYNFGNYDNALPIGNFGEADLGIIWFDPTDLDGSGSVDAHSWLIERARALRDRQSAPVVVLTWTSFQSTDLTQYKDELHNSDIHVVDLFEVANSRNTELFDLRNLAQSKINPRFYPYVAQELGCHWIPATVMPPIKAVVTDLDNTLYGGVLGEDGGAEIDFNQHDTEYQDLLKSLISRGVFVSLASRNVEIDVKELFSSRQDFRIAWEDFVLPQVGWVPKSQLIANIIEFLDIGQESVLIIDDNPGELAEIQTKLPEIHMLLAVRGPALSFGLRYYPGLWQWSVSRDAKERIEDKKSDTARLQLSSSLGSELEYLRELESRVSASTEVEALLPRLQELSIKTNQFNMNLSRFSQIDLMRKIQDPLSFVSAVSLEDRFASSGIVGLIVGHNKSDTIIEIEEFCISCRALGRGIETAILVAALDQLPQSTDDVEIRFTHREGPRNRPALNWLDSVCEGSISIRLGSLRKKVRFGLD